MKRLSAIFLALGLALAAGSALAQTYGGYEQDPYSDPYGSRVTNAVPDRYGNRSTAIYDYARVIRVDPIIDSRYRDNGRNTYASNGRYTVVNGQRCYESSGGRYVTDRDYRGYNDPYAPQQDPYGTTTGRTLATVIGGVAGALIGSKVGGGSGQVAATAIGTMVGGMGAARSTKPRNVAATKAARCR
jgi:uncharacterized protein YcfJ